MLMIKNVLCNILIIFFLTTTVSAKIRLESLLSDNTLMLGDETTLQLKIDGTQDGIGLKFPNVIGLSFRQLGSPSSSTQTIIVNGKISRFSGLVYNIGIRAEKIGNYHVPGIQVEYQNRIYSSQDFNLRVIAPDQSSSMKVLTVVSSSRIYLNESIEITLKWYLQSDVEDYTFSFPLLDKKDKLSLQLVEVKGSGIANNININNYRITFQQKTEYIGRDPFTVYEARFKIFPFEPGIFKIPPASVKAMIKKGSQLQRDFFGRVIRAPKLERVFAVSQAIEVDVLPLPEEERPSTFTGAVGKYEIQMTANATRAKVGDPVEISIKITGNGRLEKIDHPVVSDNPEYRENFVVVDNLQPGDLQEDAIVFKQTIRPRHANVQRIPAVSFTYFDPEREKYVNINSNSLPLKVLPTRMVSDKDIVVHENMGQRNNRVTFVKEKRGIYANYVFEDALQPQPQTWSLFVWLLVPPLIYFSCFFVVARKRRLQNDQALVRSKFAKAVKDKRLKKAKRLLNLDGNELYQELSQTLSGYVSDKLNLGTGELATVDIQNLSERNKLSKEIADNLDIFLEKLDRLRFASHTSSREEKHKLFDEARVIMKELGKQL